MASDKRSMGVLTIGKTFLNIHNSATFFSSRIASLREVCKVENEIQRGHGIKKSQSFCPTSSRKLCAKEDST